MAMALAPRFREDFADAIVMFVRDKVRDAAPSEQRVPPAGIEPAHAV